MNNLIEKLHQVIAEKKKADKLFFQASQRLEKAQANLVKRKEEINNFIEQCEQDIENINFQTAQLNQQAQEMEAILNYLDEGLFLIEENSPPASLVWQNQLSSLTTEADTDEEDLAIHPTPRLTHNSVPVLFPKFELINNIKNCFPDTPVPLAEKQWFKDYFTLDYFLDHETKISDQEFHRLINIIEKDTLPQRLPVLERLITYHLHLFSPEQIDSLIYQARIYNFNSLFQILDVQYPPDDQTITSEEFLQIKQELHWWSPSTLETFIDTYKDDEIFTHDQLQELVFLLQPVQ